MQFECPHYVQSVFGRDTVHVGPLPLHVLAVARYSEQCDNVMLRWAHAFFPFLATFFDSHPAQYPFVQVCCRGWIAECCESASHRYRGFPPLFAFSGVGDFVHAIVPIFRAQGPARAADPSSPCGTLGIAAV